MPSSMRSSQPRDRTQVSCFEGDSLPSEPPWKPNSSALALAGNRTQASCTAGENSSTEPPMLTPTFFRLLSNLDISCKDIGGTLASCAWQSITSLVGFIGQVPLIFLIAKFNRKLRNFWIDFPQEFSVPQNRLWYRRPGYLESGSWNKEPLGPTKQAPGDGSMWALYKRAGAMESRVSYWVSEQLVTCWGGRW